MTSEKIAAAVPDSIAREIKEALDCSMAAWNAGDLDGFLGCYDDSPRTSYLTADRIVIGYMNIEKLYAERFATSTAAGRGTLGLSLLRVVPLGPEHVLAIGRYMIARDEVHGGSEDGVFSLVLGETSRGWRIIADHTSA